MSLMATRYTAVGIRGELVSHVISGAKPGGAGGRGEEVRFVDLV